MTASMNPRISIFALSSLLAALTVSCDDPADSDDPKPVLTMKKIKNPTWQPVDFHRFSADVGEAYSHSLRPTEELLPPPGHVPSEVFGIGPGAAHPGPYDTELTEGMRAQGFVEQSTFTQEEVTLPLSAFAIWMIVPTSAAPSGSSPDSPSGPIIPNTLFPLHVDFQAYFDGVAVDGDHGEFDVPPLDAALDPPFDVDGHSHFPIVFIEDLASLPGTTGTHEWRGTMIDAAGNGWELSTSFKIVE